MKIKLALLVVLLFIAAGGFLLIDPAMINPGIVPATTKILEPMASSSELPDINVEEKQPAQASAPAAATDDDGKDKTVIAKFGNETIYKWEADEVITRLMASQNLPNKSYHSLKSEEQIAVVREIATKKLLKNAIASSKIAEQKEVKNNLRIVMNDFLQNEYLTRHAKAAITPQTIKDQYDKVVKEIANKEEFKLRYILVDSEEDANKISAELAKTPGNFAKLAKEKSKDRSKDTGGDIGYALQGTIVKELDVAAAALKKGEVSKPIKTDLGWNIIKLEDRRQAVVAPFDTIKDKVEQELIQQNIQEYLKSLLDGVNVELVSK